MAILTGRQEMAIAINLQGRKVLTMDRDQYMKDGYSGGSMVCVLSKSGSRHVGRLGSDAEGKEWWASHPGIMITSGWSLKQYLDFAAEANAPVIEEGSKIAVVEYSRKANAIRVHTMVARKVNTMYAEMATFEEE